jgi:predicted transcriptional regulator
MSGTPDEKLLIEPVRRVAAFERLADGPTTRADLQDELDVSRATLHRVVTDLVDADLAVERDGDVVLTPLGTEVADAVVDYADRVGAAERVAPLLNNVEPEELPIPMSARVFAEADVLRPAPSQPQRPVQRVLSAVRSADSMRAMAPVVLPAYVDVVYEAILDGASCELVLETGALDVVTDTYDERFASATATSQLDVLVHDQVPFGLLLTDESVCVVAYDEEGVLQAAVAGDDDRLRSWAESCYDHYSSAAGPLRETEQTTP